MSRSSGILMHISSLPGPYGIGCFGEQALDFGRKMAKAQIRYWQVLPFTIPGKGHSPYLSVSAFAGNPLFIDPEPLRKEGWLSEEDLLTLQMVADEKRIDFEMCRRTKKAVLRRAYSQLPENVIRDVRRFARHRFWLKSYALFMTATDIYEGLPWKKWPDERLRAYDEEALALFMDEHEDQYLYYCFEQYLFYSQWHQLKNELNAMGVFIIGDIPIYVSENSADLWANRSLFQVDEDDNLTAVAGVPPDYFTEEGQLWGNPLYDWPAHRADGYKWWTERLRVNFDLYDWVRIDHFRGLSSYWSVPPDHQTAILGRWEKGPGIHFFSHMQRVFKTLPIFAEDLGEETEDLHKFLDESGFPGMRVLQFAFDTGKDNKHLPHHFPADCVAYSGTHDNDTLWGWYNALQPKYQLYAARYCGVMDYGEKGKVTKAKGMCVMEAIMKMMWQSHSDCVIVPVQDLLFMDSSRRMNIPGKASGNWVVRFTEKELDQIDFDRIKAWNMLYARAGDEDI